MVSPKKHFVLRRTPHVYLGRRRLRVEIGDRVGLNGMSSVCLEFTQVVVWRTILHSKSPLRPGGQYAPCRRAVLVCTPLSYCVAGVIHFRRERENTGIMQNGLMYCGRPTSAFPLYMGKGFSSESS